MGIGQDSAVVRNELDFANPSHEILARPLSLEVAYLEIQL